jgi:hypothetical protein
MKTRKGSKFITKIRRNVSAIGTLKQKFHDNFTIVNSSTYTPNQWVPGYGYVSGYQIEAQVYIKLPGSGEYDVISASVYSKHIGYKIDAEKAAQELIIKLQRLRVEI